MVSMLVIGSFYILIKLGSKYLFFPWSLDVEIWNGNSPWGGEARKTPPRWSNPSFHFSIVWFSPEETRCGDWREYPMAKVKQIVIPLPLDGIFFFWTSAENSTKCSPLQKLQANKGKENSLENLSPLPLSISKHALIVFLISVSESLILILIIAMNWWRSIGVKV